ncbi:hypothetical protein [Haliangium sp. UPWRP_2]|uniref:hypothetical protein n=1 Tax=Haliangium sp. UPWRP_2 TaxID=1931276 RepID=UPI000B53CA4E|nr:hypothetical protein [Haliangium sp. UPWRP_2]PSM31777.1 hypothetical protein BVG81_003625 [Haliangium sp. UPWRP_2]
MYQLAALSGLSVPTLKQVEHAAGWPSPETCVALLSVTALHLQTEDIAEFVTNLAEASELAQRLWQLSQARIAANPALIARTTRPDSDKSGSARKEDPDRDPAKTPAPSKPKVRLLFTLRGFADGSIVFIPSRKARQ